MEFAFPVRNLPLRCTLLVFLIVPGSDFCAPLMAMQLMPVDQNTFQPCL